MLQKICLLLILLFAGFAPFTLAAEEPLQSSWVRMPAGARPTYMGIHGGTMPVSLLVSDDGSSLLTFVGRTGNDFIEVLHRTEFQIPSLLKKVAQNATRDALQQSPILHAGNKKVSMPVLYSTGFGFQHTMVNDCALLPFGFSDEPISIEGHVRIPETKKTTTKRYRLFFQPHYLTPR
ncbi:MAG: hypothetical protein J5803_05560 [Desulfovibrio sp.]|nr:hypothetical protein [Desulfovibrio sp.]